MSNINDQIESQINTYATPTDAKASSEKLGTLADQQDMYRMGKVPSLRVSFLSVFG